MKILYTRNGLPLSRLIRWGLDEPVSHMAIEFDDKIIFQSNLFGVHLTFASNFRAKNEVVFEQTLPTTEVEENATYFNVIAKHEGRSWDFSAFFYWAYCVINFKLLKKPYPSVNKLASKRADLCVELARSLPERFSIKGIDLAMVSPYAVFLIVDSILEKLKNDVVVK